jgi:hypothetical protein
VLKNSPMRVLKFLLDVLRDQVQLVANRLGLLKNAWHGIDVRLLLGAASCRSSGETGAAEDSHCGW